MPAHTIMMDQFLSLPMAFVDKAFGCDREVLEEFVLAVESHPDHSYTTPNIPSFVKEYQTRARAALAALVEQVSPYQLPKDFIQFQSLTGGAMCEPADGWLLDVFGNGIFAHQFHSGLLSEGLDEIWSLRIIHYLPIASLVRYGLGDTPGFRCDYFLALETPIENGAVYSVESDESGADTIEFIVKERRLPIGHNLAANSFSTWLQLAVESGGLFSYRL